MEITYKSQKLEKVCTNARKATQEYGLEMAEKIHQRIDQIKAADTIGMMIQHRIGRCHALLGDRDGQYAVDLVHPQRLIFTVRGETVQVAKIEEIVDYH